MVYTANLGAVAGEVDQEGSAEGCCFQVGFDLRVMCGAEGFAGLQLDNDFPFNEQVEQMTTNQVTVIVDGNILFCFNP